MAIQDRNNIDNEPFVLDDSAEVETGKVLASGQGDLVVGTALGIVGPASGVASGAVGRLKVCDAVSGVDGSQIPVYLLADESVANASGVTSGITVYSKGLFDKNKVVFASGTTLSTDITLSTDDDVYTTPDMALRSKGIRLSDVVSEGGYENA